MKSIYEQIDETLKEGSTRKIRRTHGQMQARIDESFQLVSEIEDLKMLNDEGEEGVNEWTTKCETARTIRRRTRTI